MGRKKWYVTYRGQVVDEFMYSSKKLGNALALARIYKTLQECVTGHICIGVRVEKMDGEPGEPLHRVHDGTQRHYV